MRRSPSSSPLLADGTSREGQVHLPPDAGDTLLPLARAAIAAELGVRLPADDSAAWLREPGCCFVTLTTRGRLHGCIGSTAPRHALLDDVRANAIGAAFRDPRFPALTRGELGVTSIEVSVLSPTSPLTFTSEIDATVPAAAGCRRRRPRVRRPPGDVPPAGVGAGARSRGVPRPSEDQARLAADVLERRPDPESLHRDGVPRGGTAMTHDHRPHDPVATSGGPTSSHPARYWQALEDDRIQCDLCPRECRLRDGQRGFCFVRLQPGRPDGAGDLRSVLGVLHRPDREEAAAPLLPRQQRAVLRHRRLQPGLQVLPELGHLQVARDGPADGPRLAARHRPGRRGVALPQRRVHLQRPGDLRGVRPRRRRGVPRARPQAPSP